MVYLLFITCHTNILQFHVLYNLINSIEDYYYKVYNHINHSPLYFTLYTLLYYKSLIYSIKHFINLRSKTIIAHNGRYIYIYIKINFYFNWLHYIITVSNKFSSFYFENEFSHVTKFGQLKWHNVPKISSHETV